MKERIQELFNKASVYAYEQNPGENSYGRPVDENKYEEDRYKKFAELIIKESANLVEDFEITQEVADGEYVDYEASAVLKEYWGIK